MANVRTLQDKTNIVLLLLLLQYNQDTIFSHLIKNKNDK